MNEELVAFINIHQIAILVVYSIIAISFSLFYGFNAIYIFWNEDYRKTNFKDEEHKCLRMFNQFWLNFAGSIGGWISLYVVISYLISHGTIILTNAHILFFVIGIIGITGLLPMTLFDIINGPYEIIKKFLK